ncbi:aspartate dehydrogenase [uncultured Oscillibacter sp.]|uniref:aspartate dehydrogenase n=1 Tax=uncultured Oscillibacter sp. TaxID=876091 RepID=UPI002625D4A9|nr:aspartate dehydrogenase [uncultured Oscillibacter sp.]
MFGKRKQPPVIPFDRGGRVPVIHSSICTGEQTAGFKDPVSGRFQEYMLIRNDGDLQEFLRRYQVTEAELKREW